MSPFARIAKAWLPDDTVCVAGPDPAEIPDIQASALERWVGHAAARDGDILPGGLSGVCGSVAPFGKAAWDGWVRCGHGHPVTWSAAAWQTRRRHVRRPTWPATPQAHRPRFVGGAHDVAAMQARMALAGGQAPDWLASRAPPSPT